jgi:putative membrane protein
MKKMLKKLTKFTDDYENKEEIILRDHLAMERTKLAKERTLLSYVRTSLYLVLGGIAFLGMENFKEIKYIGYFALVLSAIILLIGIVRFFQLKRHMKKIYEPFYAEEEEEETKVKERIRN